MPAFLLILGLAHATPPDVVLARLDTGLRALAETGVIASFGSTTEVRYSDPDGTDAHVDVVETRHTPGSDGRFTGTVVSHLRDGVSVTEEEKKGKDEGEGETPTLSAPVGKDRSRYVFGDIQAEGATAVASYSPAAGVPSAKDLATGRVAWDPATEAPLWIEYRPVQKPMLVQSLFVRVDLTCSGDQCRAWRLLTRGQGGLPGLRKSFVCDVRFHDVVWL